MSEASLAARVSLWWDQPSAAPGAMGHVGRLQVSVRGAEFRAAVPERVPLLARVLSAPEAPCSLWALKLYGLGVFSLSGPPSAEGLLDGLSCELPAAAADDLLDALARVGWLRHLTA